MIGHTSKQRLVRKAKLANKPSPQPKQPKQPKGWNKVAMARSISQWSQLIETIGDDVIRAQVARIVWWDYVAPQQKLLDKYLTFRDSERLMNINKVRAMLVSIGYPVRVAIRRVQRQEASVRAETAIGEPI